MKRWVTTCVAALSLGCLDAIIEPLDPMTGPALVDRCVNDDSDPDVDVSYADDIQPIFLKMTAQPGCGCHIPTNPNPIGFEQAGLDLSTYAGLRRGGNNSLSGAVVEGAPCDSVLWQKISPGPPFGSRMPFDGPPFLDPPTRRLIADWIAEGARDN